MTGIRPPRAFTLVELLIVVTVLAMLMGIGMGTILRRDDREVNVKAAADELAAVLRATRAKAMERYGTYGVVFNIQNPPGSSGRQLTNGSGGHWYRVIGPYRAGFYSLTVPPIFNRYICARDGSYIGGNLFTQDNAFRYFPACVAASWIGDKHQLPVGKVRFVALTDQDNGDYTTGNNPHYAPTYPRPWCGWWDPTTMRLYPWGGYDTTLRTGANPSHSGFYYEGLDGPITGSVNPSGRLVYDDLNNDSQLNTATPGENIPSFTAWNQGDPRPLINADWEDFMVLFQPDGSATVDWMRMRHGYGDNSYAYGAFGSLTKLGVGDRCNQAAWFWGDWSEGTGYAARSGFSFITLGGDLAGDNDVYPSAQEALNAIMPLYRVGISPFGEVRVFKVYNTDRSQPPRNLDTTITGNQWSTQAVTDAFYQGQCLTNADGSPRGTPVLDILTTDMMTKRTWWWQQ